MVRDEKGRAARFPQCLPAAAACAGQRAHRAFLRTRIPCVPHGLKYGFDGKLLDGGTGGDLTPLEIKQKSGLILVRAAGAAREGGPALTGWDEFAALAPAGVQEIEVAADWKLLVEQWLEGAPSRGRFLAPNQLVRVGRAGRRFCAVLPLGAGAQPPAAVGLRRARQRGKGGWARGRHSAERAP